MNILKNKIDFAFKIGDLFEENEKKIFFGIMLLSIVTSIFQVVGIASIFPFMNLVMDPNLILTDRRYFYFYDQLNFSNQNTFIIFVGFFVLLFIIMSNLISTLTQWLKYSFVWRNNHKISVSLLKKYLSLPYEYFLNQNTSNLGKNILSEVQNLTSNFIFPLLKIVTGFTLVFVIFSMLLYINYGMTLIAGFILGGLYFLIYLKFSKKIKNGGEQRLIENKNRFIAAGEALGGIKDVKILNKEAFFVNQFSKYSKNYNHLEAWYQIVSRTPKYIMEIIAFGGVVALVLFLVSSGYSGSEIIPLIGLFAFAGYRLMPALQDIFDSFVIFRFNKAVLHKIHKDMSEHSFEKETFYDNSLKSMVFKDCMELKNASFAYPHSLTKVLNNVNLSIKKNTAVAIVGQTGSGKTTIADIILGLFSPEEGELLVDGLKITEDNIRSWQMNIGYVPQNIYLSDNTITRNIAFGTPDNEIRIAQVKKVAKMANIAQFIENDLPDKYETVIGERGIRLSGGQRQRLGIARALYHNPEVLVFDEATSSLDNLTEKMVLEAIDNIAKFKTMIIIAHRLTTIKNCDTIYLLDRGKVVASGTYDELLKNSPQFRKLAKSGDSKK